MDMGIYLKNTKKHDSRASKLTDWSKPVCEACFRNVDPDKAIPVTVDLNTFEVIENGTPTKTAQAVLIGKDCWKKLKASTI